jgi:hypothetical protein
MKTLIILLLSLSAYSKCEPYIPLSRAQAIAAITAYEQLADIPMKLCKDAPDEECLCSEGDVSASKIVDVFENGAPIYGPKTNVKKCMSEQDCAGFIGICGPGEGEFFYALLPEPELVEPRSPGTSRSRSAISWCRTLRRRQSSTLPNRRRKKPPTSPLLRSSPTVRTSKGWRPPSTPLALRRTRSPGR